MKTLFVGGGNMATALIRGAIESGVPRRHLIVSERSPEQRQRLQQLMGIACVGSNDPLPSDIAAVVWAVKPQHMEEATREVASLVPDALHISIAAGLRASLLRRWLRTDRVVRAMPNSGAAVGAGVTGLYALDTVTVGDRAFAQALFEATGEVFWVDSDERLDAVTAVSGSGPAYVFHFLEGLQLAAEALGFPADVARKLALQTAEGAVKQASSAGEAFGTLRHRVTSEKGTTAAALAVLDERMTQAALVDAVQAACDRSAEIADEWDPA
jgi:pyrroline-5-carboxylate reductase